MPGLENGFLTQNPWALDPVRDRLPPPPNSGQTAVCFQTVFKAKGAEHNCWDPLPKNHRKKPWIALSASVGKLRGQQERALNFIRTKTLQELRMQTRERSHKTITWFILSEVHKSSGRGILPTPPSRLHLF